MPVKLRNNKQIKVTGIRLRVKHEGHKTEDKTDPSKLSNQVRGAYQGEESQQWLLAGQSGSHQK